MYTHVGVCITVQQKKRKDKEQFIPKGQICFRGLLAAHHYYSTILVFVQRSSCGVEPDCKNTSTQSKKNSNVVHIYM